MSLVVDAIYEAGVLRPLVPLSNLKEHERVRLTLELVAPEEGTPRLIEEQRQHRIEIDADLAREIGDSHEYGLIGG